MSEVTTRPSAGKTKAPARRSTATSAPYEEAYLLALDAVKVLQQVLMAATYDGNEPRRTNVHFEQADRLIRRLLDPVATDHDETDPLVGDVLEHLARISSELEFAVEVLAEKPPEDTASALVTLAVGKQAFDLADRIFLAYKHSPHMLDQLRALTTFAGARDFRDRPQPPIRREPTKGFHVPRNACGTIFLRNKEEVREFVNENASFTANMSMILSNLIASITEPGGPDYGPISELAEHVNDLVFQQEQATRLLLNEGDAA